MNWAERFIVEHRMTSAALVLLAVALCVYVPRGHAWLEARDARIDADYRAGEIKFHRRHDEWVQQHSGNIWLVCREPRCKCEDICDRDGIWGWKACTSTHAEIMPNGDVVCRVP